MPTKSYRLTDRSGRARSDKQNKEMEKILGRSVYARGSANRNPRRMGLTVKQYLTSEDKKRSKRPSLTCTCLHNYILKYLYTCMHADRCTYLPTYFSIKVGRKYDTYTACRHSPRGMHHAPGRVLAPSVGLPQCNVQYTVVGEQNRLVRLWRVLG